MIGRFFLAIAAKLLRRRDGAVSRELGCARVLVIRRNRLGDMICTLPLLHALKRHFSSVHLVVACDEPGAPIARACDAVDETIVLEARGFLWLRLLRDAKRLQGFDWVIAGKGGFDRRVASLTRLTNGIRSIGFAENDAAGFAYFTDPVTLPADVREHQIETQLRLLAPLRAAQDSPFLDLSLAIPASAQSFATDCLARLNWSAEFMLINISSTSRLLFRDEDFLELIAQVLGTTALAIGFVAAPADQAKAGVLAGSAGSKRVAAIPTPGPIELAALLRRAAVFVTPEGGAAHLAAAMETPAVVLWSEGPFEKWRSRSEWHLFVRAETGETTIAWERVLAALKSLLAEPSRRERAAS
jgi:ADP-heptose:LPS heptosyltransferase